MVLFVLGGPSDRLESRHYQWQQERDCLTPPYWRPRESASNQPAYGQSKRSHNGFLQAMVALRRCVESIPIRSQTHFETLQELSKTVKRCRYRVVLLIAVMLTRDSIGIIQPNPAIQTPKENQWINPLSNTCHQSASTIQFIVQRSYVTQLSTVQASELAQWTAHVCQTLLTTTEHRLRFCKCAAFSFRIDMTFVGASWVVFGSSFGVKPQAGSLRCHHAKCFWPFCRAVGKKKTTHTQHVYIDI